MDGTSDFESNIMPKIIDHLRVDAGFQNVSISETGGGILCIDIPCGRYLLRFGTANETWGADVYLDDEFLEGQGIDTTCLTTEEDASEVARVLMMAAQQFDEGHSK
jgi:hypothetical protein